MASKIKTSRSGALRLILVRHPETIWQDIKNPENNSHDHRLLGQTDIDLSKEGLTLAQKLAKHFSKQKIDQIITSPLKRAYATAEIIASANGESSAQFENGLKEISFGLCEGLTFGEVADKFPEVYKAYLSQSASITFPEGESFGSFQIRVRKWLNKFIAKNKNQTVLTVAHGGTIRIILCALLGWPTKSFWQIGLHYGSISIVEVYKKSRVIECLNCKI
ncbi:MAG: histidine phosphatase family protein [Candidatus Paceibacterota bacterium]|jgi:broad specificity phosphatase PhoE